MLQHIICPYDKSGRKRRKEEKRWVDKTVKAVMQMARYTPSKQKVAGSFPDRITIHLIN
jgi:hypothetical protein